jgi:YggT family protein
MAANSSNAVIFLIAALFDIAMCVFLLRVLLQLTSAHFHNPISQLIWRLTNPVSGRLARALPRWRRLDPASAIVLLAIAMIYVRVVAACYNLSLGWPESCWIAILKVASLTLNLYTLSLFAIAIISWIGPGVSNPAANVLWSLNEPLLRPVRRLLPPISGLDLSPIPVMLALQFADRLLPLPGLFHQ